MTVLAREHKPILITPNMPQQVAKVAKVLNALKLSPDPICGVGELPGEGTSIRANRGEIIVRTLDLVDGKSIIDIGCGPVNENGETIILEVLRKVGTKPSLYVGVDPTISPRFLGEQRAETERVVYLPVSLYQLDESALDYIGKLDLVFSSMFFGAPIGSSASIMLKRIGAALNEMFWLDRSQFRSEHPELEEIESTYMKNILHGGILRDFLEFMIQEYCRRLVKDNGIVAHFVLVSEGNPDFEIAKAAGLEVRYSDKIKDGTDDNIGIGTLSLFTPVRS